MASPKPLSIAIIGGGISGLILAIGLRPYSHLHITIYESVSMLGPVGAGLTLGPNAQRGLASISPAIAQVLRDQETPCVSPGFENRWFQLRFAAQGSREGEVLATINSETRVSTVHRSKFLDSLLQMLPEDMVQFGKRLVGIEELKSGAGLRLHFADKTTATTDCLFGADGIHSVVRKHLLGVAHPEASPVFTGAIAYRGLVPMKIAREKLGSFAESTYSWCKDGNFVINYPIDHGEMVNVVVVQPGKESWNESTYVVDADRDDLKKDYRDWAEIPRTVVELIERPTKWAILDHLSAPTYHFNNIAIIGDAAHASSPWLGAGVGQAIEDSMVLIALLGEVRTKEDFTRAIAAYDSVRRPRASKVASTSRETIKLYHFSDIEVNSDGETRRDKWNEKIRWIWDIDLAKQNDEALALFFKSPGGAIDVKDNNLPFRSWL